MMEDVMEILGVSSNPMEAVPDYLSSAQNGTVGTESGATAGSAGAPATGGDTVNFSPEALQLSASSGIAPLASPFESMTAKEANGVVAYDLVSVSSTGVVAWNCDSALGYVGAVTLDLSSLSALGVKNFVIQSGSTGFSVWDADKPHNSSTPSLLELDKNGQVDPDATHYTHNQAGPGLLVVGDGNYTGPWHGPGMIVNLAGNTGASINGGTGSATIYNFANSVGAITAGDGTATIIIAEKNNSGNIFTVGLSAGTIVAGAAANVTKSATLTILGNMSNCTINTNGDLIIEAEQFALNNVTIAASSTSETTIKAKTIKNDPSSTATITLGDGPNKIVVSGNMINADVTGGANVDDVLIKGKSTGNKFDLGAGDDKVRIYGAVSNSDFDLGAGANTFTAQGVDKQGLDAALKNLTGVTITAGGSTAADYTIVTANVLKSTKDKESSIKLLGSGENEVYLKSIAGNRTKGVTKGVTIELGNSASTKTQMLDVKGGAKFLDFKSGAGNDMLTFLGSISNSFFDLGDGDNTFTAVKKNKQGQDKGQKLTNVGIKAGDGDSSGTTITAGAYKAGADYNSIELGDGAHTITLGAISAYKKGTVDIKIDPASTGNQALTIGGAANGLTYVGGAGNDIIKINGAVRNSSFALGDGANTFEAVKKNNQGQDKGQKLTNVGITGGVGTGNSTEVTFGRLLSGGKNAPDMGPWSGNITINLKV